MEKIKASGILKVALYKDNAPYSDGPVSGMVGLDVGLAQALARQMQLNAALLPFDSGENMNDDLRNMVWRGHYLGYGPADVMLHVPVDKYFMAENRQAFIFGPYAREHLVVLHNPQQLAHGISIALYNTGFGIFIAIPSVIFWRHFRAQVDGFVVEMEQQAIRLVEYMHGERK